MEVNELSDLLANHSKENREDIHNIYNELKNISSTINEIKANTEISIIKMDNRISSLENSKKENKTNVKYTITTLIAAIALIFGIFGYFN